MKYDNGRLDVNKHVSFVISRNQEKPNAFLLCSKDIYSPRHKVSDIRNILEGIQYTMDTYDITHNEIQIDINGESLPLTMKKPKNHLKTAILKFSTIRDHTTTYVYWDDNEFILLDRNWNASNKILFEDLTNFQYALNFIRRATLHAH